MSSVIIVDTAKYKMEPLRIENYFRWSRKIKQILRSERVCKILMREETELAVAASDNDKAEFEEKKHIALTLIVITNDDSCSENGQLSLQSNAQVGRKILR